jgi:hypothetical protein
MTHSMGVREPGGVATPSPRRKHRRAAAAAYISDNFFPCSPKTLAKLACVGGSPPMEYAGRIPLYPQDGLDAWASAKISPRVNSTSELRVIRSAAAAAHVTP